MPQRMPCRNAVAPGRMCASMPNAVIASGASESSANRTMPKRGRQPQRLPGTAARSPRAGRRRPSATPTAAAAISVPIGTVIGSQNSAVPDRHRRQRIPVPWWPAIALSTKPINPLDRWPSDQRQREQHAVAPATRRETARDGRWCRGHAGGSTEVRRIARRRVILSHGQRPDHHRARRHRTRRRRPACENCSAPLLGDTAPLRPAGEGPGAALSAASSAISSTACSTSTRASRTIWPLFAKPGFLSLEYFAGRACATSARCACSSSSASSPSSSPSS